MEKIWIVADHAGFDLKQNIIKLMTSTNCQFIDCGTDSKDSVSYVKAGLNMLTQFNKECDADPIADVTKFGIMICGSGIGMSIIANRLPTIRATLCHNLEYATLARKHNNANVLCLGARFVTIEEAMQIVQSFISTSFEGNRHIERVCGLSNSKFH